jgi:hypothetical protein
MSAHDDIDPVAAYRMGVLAQKMNGPPVEVSSRDIKELVRLTATTNRLLLHQIKLLEALMKK